MASGLASWSQTAANNSTADSSVNWAEGQAPSTVNDSARALMASAAKWRDDVSGALTTAGTSTAFTLTSNQSFASLAALDGQMLYMKMSATSGASPTLAVDGLTAKALTTDGSTAIATGALISGSVWGVTYKTSAGAFIIHAAPLATPSFTTVSASSTISASGQFLGKDGTKTSPSFSFTNDGDTGLYSIGANNLGVSCGDTKILDIATTGVTLTGTLDVSGALTASNFAYATQANQETGTSTMTIVSPGRQHFHKSAAKFVLVADAAGNLNSTHSYNITSITDSGVGTLDVTIATDFSDANYCVVACGQIDSQTCFMVNNTSPPTAGTYRIKTLNGNSAASQDPALHYNAGFGDQA